VLVEITDTILSNMWFGRYSKHLLTCLYSPIHMSLIIEILQNWTLFNEYPGRGQQYVPKVTAKY